MVAASLLALCLPLPAANAADAPSAGAPAPAAETVKIMPAFQLMSRGEWSRGRTEAGQANLANGGEGPADTADFYIRRFRMGAKAAYGAWSAQALVHLDNTDRDGVAGRSGKASIFVASAKAVAAGDAARHEFQTGLDYAFFNDAAFGSSGAQLLPADRASQELLTVRGVGVGYRISSGIAKFGVDVQNNVGDDKDKPGGAAEGLCYTARLELGRGLKRWCETNGTDAGERGFIWAAEIGYNNADRRGATSASPTNAYTVDTLVVGSGLLVHWDGLSLLAEGRWARTQVREDAGPTPASGMPGRYQAVALIQAGWQMRCPLSGLPIEPALRLTRMDYNADERDERGGFGGKDYSSTSGWQGEVGLNIYLRDHANKVDIGWTRWKAEAGNDKADIIRVQHHLSF